MSPWLLLSWLSSSPVAGLLGPSLSESCLLVPLSPRWSESLALSCGCSPGGGRVGPHPQGLALGLQWRTEWGMPFTSGPSSPRPGFPLSHLRKESPNGGSEEEQ